MRHKHHDTTDSFDDCGSEDVELVNVRENWRLRTTTVSRCQVSFRNFVEKSRGPSNKVSILFNPWAKSHPDRKKKTNNGSSDVNCLYRARFGGIARIGFRNRGSQGQRETYKNERIVDVLL